MNYIFVWRPRRDERTVTPFMEQMFIPQTLAQLAGAIEAVLFVHTEPVSIGQLVQWTGWDKTKVEAALRWLQDELDRDGRGLRLLHEAGGYQLATKAEFHPVLTNMGAARQPPSLSRAALETLAIIAYRQPVTRAEIERLRGVGSQGALYALQERELIEEAARADLPGRPILYRTTERFLHWCGIPSLEELPPLPDPPATEGAASWLEAAAAHEEARQPHPPETTPQDA